MVSPKATIEKYTLTIFQMLQDLEAVVNVAVAVAVADVEEAGEAAILAMVTVIAGRALRKFSKRSFLEHY